MSHVQSKWWTRLLMVQYILVCLKFAESLSFDLLFLMFLLQVGSSLNDCKSQCINNMVNLAEDANPLAESLSFDLLILIIPLQVRLSLNDCKSQCINHAVNLAENANPIYRKVIKMCWQHIFSNQGSGCS